MTHHNFVHKIVPKPQEMKFPDAKVAVDKEWKKLETVPSWDLGKVRSKKEGIRETQRDKKIHFASLMDMCHLKKCEVRTNVTKE